MYTWLAVAGVLVAAALIHYKPGSGSGFGSSSSPDLVGFDTTEGFTTTAIHPTRMPECVARSTDAQKLLERIATIGNDVAEELRLLVSKLCCMETDIAAPSAGVYRTQHIQFRTSHDMEPPSSLVGRCLRNAVNQRDIDLIIEKFTARGHILVKELCADPQAKNEFDNVVGRLRLAMTSFCLKESPHMDRPSGPRDLGFWEPPATDLPQYQGVSSTPK